MPRNKKKFIDKNNSDSWRLFPRAQDDIHFEDALAPQKILVRVPQANNSSNQDSLEERRKYGIFFDDEYDYMQHLRTRQGQGMDLQVPQEQAVSEAQYCPSSVTEEVTPDFFPTFSYDGQDMDEDDDFFDPEIEEAILGVEGEEDQEGIDELEDDFINLANRPEEVECPKLEANSEMMRRYLDNSSCDVQLDQDNDEDVEEKVTASSVTSRRQRPQTYQEELLEEQFDRLVEMFDDETQDMDDFEVSSQLTKSNLYVLEQHRVDMDKDVITLADIDSDKLDRAATLKALEALSDSDDSDVDPVDIWASADRRTPLEFTCQTAPRVSASTHRPHLLRLSPRRNSSCNNDSDTDESETESGGSTATEEEDNCVAEPSDQPTITDRKQLKKAVKELQRERRRQKKEMKQNFAKGKTHLTSTVTRDIYQQGKVIRLT